jgi:hypothetical protein
LDLEPHFTGQCHCGRVHATFRVSTPDLQVRACQCGFCRRHGAKNVSDTDGFAEIISDGPLVRYHFGLMSADVLLCPVCGVYVGSALEADGITRVSLNAAGLAMAPYAGSDATPMDYSGETLHERLDRRRARWTPARVVERSPA